MRITHKVDYGIRVMTSLAVLGAEQPGKPISRSVLAARDSVPSGFIDDILRLLRNGQLVRSHRGAEGGWTLARPPAAISVADVIRVLEGPIASVRGLRPHELPSEGVAEPLVTLWIDPAEHQILQYTFDNIDMDFLPGRSIVRVDELKASMKMLEPFPAVWLPGSIEMHFLLTTALGSIDARYDVAYREYRLAEVTTRIKP